MHELSLCRDIYGIVDRARDGQHVTAVHLQIGQLRQVVPATLAYCWHLVVESTPMAGSELDVDHVPVVLDCAACGARTTVGHALALTCSGCSSGDVTLVAGEEMLVTSIDLLPRDTASTEET